MASSPTISETNDVNAPVTAAKLPLMPLIGLMLLTAALSVSGSAGVLLYLVKSGRLGGVAAESASTPAAAPAKPDMAKSTHSVALDPLLVNLADADGHGYLRLGVTLRVEDPADKAKTEESKDSKISPEEGAPLRDTVIDVLGRQKAEDLAAPESKERLKMALKAAFDERNPTSKVTEIYFTDFLVQR